MDDKISDRWKRFAESWMDLLPELDLIAPAIQAEVTLRRQQHNAQQAAMQVADDQRVIEPWTDAMEQVIYDEAIFGFTSQRMVVYFHSFKTLIALIFMSTAVLSPD